MAASTDIAGLEQLIDDYCAAWNEPDTVRRDTILKRVWAENATYTDPRANTRGIQELSAHISKIIASRPGAKIIRTSAVDSHHGLARFAWRVMQADGNLLPEGIDFVELSTGGKIQRVVGFFGSLAPKE